MIDIELDEQFKGLKGEIVQDDIYLLRDKQDIVSINDPTFIHVKGHKRAFDFEPTIVFDIGANYGLFTKYCRDLFPNATIVSVEPHPPNFSKLLQTVDGDEKCFPLNIAIGEGTVFTNNNAVNGSGQCYLSKGLGYKEIETDESLSRTAIQTRHLSEIIEQIVDFEKDKIIVKIDIEGGENTIFTHKSSMDILKKADYITMEVHWFAQTADQVPQVRETTLSAFKSLEDTHNCVLDNCYFYAVKK